MSVGDKYFQGNPVRLDVSRSRFPLNHNWRGSFNAGEWVPFFTQEILAGDTFKVNANVLLRSTTPSNPVMDDATVSVEFFYVPFDLILSRAYMVPGSTDSNRSWRYFFGAQDNTLNMPTPASGVTLPTLRVYGGSSDYLVGGLADCLGMPKANGAGASYYKLNCLKALAYYAVYNEYLRDPNTMAPVTFSISGNNEIGFTVNADAGIPSGADTVKFSKYPLVPACANHGFFGSALPWPQRNSVSVTLPLGESAPVKDWAGNPGTAAKPYKLTGKVTTLGGTGNINFATGEGINAGIGNPEAQTKDFGQFGAFENIGGSDVFSLFKMQNVSDGSKPYFTADLSEATAASINTIRAAFATQRWYEQLARSGNRYDEMIKGMFGVTPPVKGTKPEYLGGKDIPLGIQQVNGTGDNNLGNAGATSNTFDAGHYFTKSFTEPGIVIGIMCVRTHDSFAQGVDPFDVKSERFNFYWPQFANLGEVGLPKKLLYVDGNSSGEFTSDDEAIFGYQEYAAEYRYHPDVVTGEFRPRSGVTGLPNWTYCNYFASHPTLKEFLIGGSRFKDNVDRTLTVSASTAGYQFFGMVHMDVTAVRPMPLHSIPGLLDHH